MLIESLPSPTEIKLLRSLDTIWSPGCLSPLPLLRPRMGPGSVEEERRRGPRNRRPSNKPNKCVDPVRWSETFGHAPWSQRSCAQIDCSFVICSLGKTRSVAHPCTNTTLRESCRPLTTHELITKSLSFFFLAWVCKTSSCANSESISNKPRTD